jgi:hypothetical protein
MPYQNCYSAPRARSGGIRLALALAGAAVLLCLQGCITTAVILLSNLDLPPACNSLTSAEQATLPRCGGYRRGYLETKDVNTAFAGACPLTNFARHKETWAGLPELIEMGAQPGRYGIAPLPAMAEAQACPDFTKMEPATRKAVRWLATADGRSLTGPVVHMLSCPSARQAGLTDIVERWVVQDRLSPAKANFSVLSAVHPASLGEPWVTTLIASGHTPQRAVEMDPSAFEHALADGDVNTLRWWTRHVPSLIHRVPAMSSGHAPWVPLARVMAPQFARDDAARFVSAQFLLASGADPQARLPGEGTMTVMDYTTRMQPKLVDLLLKDPALARSPVPATTPKARALMSTAAPAAQPPARVINAGIAARD